MNRSPSSNVSTSLPYNAGSSQVDSSCHSISYPGNFESLSTEKNPQSYQSEKSESVIEYSTYDPEEEDDSSYSENSEDEEYSSDEDDSNEGNTRVSYSVSGESCSHLHQQELTSSTQLPSFPTFNHHHPNLNHVVLTGLHIQQTLQQQDQYLNLSQQQQPFFLPSSKHGSQMQILPTTSTSLNRTSLASSSSFQPLYAHPVVHSLTGSFPVHFNHTITTGMGLTTDCLKPNIPPPKDDSCHVSDQVRYSSIEEDHYYTDLSLSIPSRKARPLAESNNSFQSRLATKDFLVGGTVPMDGENDDRSVGSSCSYETHNSDGSCEPIEIEEASDQCLDPHEEDNFGEIIKQTMQFDSIVTSEELLS